MRVADGDEFPAVAQGLADREPCREHGPDRNDDGPDNIPGFRIPIAAGENSRGSYGYDHKHEGDPKYLENLGRVAPWLFAKPLAVASYPGKRVAHASRVFELLHRLYPSPQNARGDT